MPQPSPPNPKTAAHPPVDPLVDAPFPASGAVPAAVPMPVPASPASVAAPVVAVPYGAGSAGVDRGDLTLHKSSQCTSGQDSTSAAATHGPATAEAIARSLQAQCVREVGTGTSVPEGAEVGLPDVEGAQNTERPRKLPRYV